MVPGAGPNWMKMEFSVSQWHYCVRSGEEEIQNEMCSISEMVKVGRGKKVKVGENCASCGASPDFHFLPDFSLISLTCFS